MEEKQKHRDHYVFNTISAKLQPKFDSYIVQIHQFSQELTYLLTIAENDRVFAENNKDDIEQIKEALGKSANCENKLSRSIMTLHTLAQEIDEQLNWTWKILFSCQNEINKVYFILNDFISEEKEKLTSKSQEIANECRIQYSQLIWKEEGNNEEVIDKNLFRTPKVLFNNSISSHVCKEQAEISFSCTKLQLRGAHVCKKSVQHVIDVFNYNAQVLANFNNLQKVLLYLKLTLEKIDKIFKTIIGQANIKIKILDHIVGVNKTLLFNDDTFAGFIDKISRQENKLNEELSKLNTYITKFPAQLQTSDQSCLPISNILSQVSLKSTNYDKLKQAYSLGKSVSAFLQVLCEQKKENKFVNNVKKSNRRVSKIRISEKIDSIDFVVEVSLRRLSQLKNTSAEANKVFYHRLNNNILYKLIHMKSTILKKFQPHSTAISLSNARNRLTELMRAHIDARKEDPLNWDKNIRVLMLKKFDFASIENKVHHSYTLNAVGSHSYESSWELQCIGDDKYSSENSEEDQPSVEYSPSSSSSSSTVSESELSEISEISYKKTEIFDHNRYRNKIRGNQDFNISSLQDLTKSLNAEVKDIHKKGLTGWKKDLKNLRKREEKSLINNEVRKRFILEMEKRRELRNRTLENLMEKEKSFSPEKNSKNMTTIYELRSQTPEPSLLTQRSERNRSSQNDSQSMKYSKSIDIIKQVQNTVYKKSVQDVITKLGRHSGDTTSNGSRFDPATRRLGEKLINQISELTYINGMGMRKTISLLTRKKKGYLQQRIASIQQDRSLSPFLKIKSIRDEFSQYGNSKPVIPPSTTSITKVKGKNVYLMSLS
ncbi:unnamed protein product [Blepharisma stoltei]|uniref:Uncharacterized protein n=1 Tax=Blepharisma stoltei TaxID=1481888 RepID=A0AAU9IRP0_9CILI|nr:unnamed protein product [Blepharisma stoltei]